MPDVQEPQAPEEGRWADVSDMTDMGFPGEGAAIHVPEGEDGEATDGVEVAPRLAPSEITSEPEAPEGPQEAAAEDQEEVDPDESVFDRVDRAIAKEQQKAAEGSPEDAELRRLRAENDRLRQMERDALKGDVELLKRRLLGGEKESAEAQEEEEMDLTAPEVIQVYRQVLEAGGDTEEVAAALAKMAGTTAKKYAEYVARKEVAPVRTELEKITGAQKTAAQVQQVVHRGLTNMKQGLAAAAELGGAELELIRELQTKRENSRLYRFLMDGGTENALPPRLSSPQSVVDAVSSMARWYEKLDGTLQQKAPSKPSAGGSAAPAGPSRRGQELNKPSDEMTPGQKLAVEMHLINNAHKAGLEGLFDPTSDVWR